ncbi:MAG: DNA polymerase subunit beta [Firmicutes bacterium]|nr:DNA polymerase subunit beta [Bacillota bacterium]
MIVEKIINKVIKELKVVSRVVGVVLGGSRARGTHRLNSDIDIGIYYDESAGIDLGEISRIATKLDDEHRENIITALGEWGPWINGGGWLIVDGYHVDFIFRDINKVSQVIKQCLSGNLSSHYQAGHPHAYLNAMYMGEIAICRILEDNQSKIAKLKDKTIPYPLALKKAIINYFTFESSFSLKFAEDMLGKDDLYYLNGHCFRSVSCLNQVLFAINENYCINEKKAVGMIASFAIKPKNYKERIEQIFSLLSNDLEGARKGVGILKNLISETNIIIDK